MKIRDIAAAIEEFAPLALQADYDNSGLVVGRLDDEVHKALLAVDVTEEVLDEAEREGCDIIITHHPIIFSPLKRFNSATYVERCVERAIKHDIALYACHTNLDSAPKGMSYRLGQMLGVGDMSILEPTVEGAGYGVVGTLAEPMAVEAFFALLREKLGCKAVRHSEVVKPTIQRVAICTGAGASAIELAAAAGCDAYVTADVKYNNYYEPDGRFVLCDVGHFESEFCAIDLLFDILSEIPKKISNFALSVACNNLEYEKYPHSSKKSCRRAH